MAALPLGFWLTRFSRRMVNATYISNLINGSWELILLYLYCTHCSIGAQHWINIYTVAMAVSQRWKCWINIVLDG